MKKLTYYFLLAMLSISITACGDDEPDVDCSNQGAIYASLQDEIDAITTTATAYGNNQSTENCNAYKAAYLDYIDALRGLRNCYEEFGILEDYDDDLNEAEDAVDDIVC